MPTTTIESMSAREALHQLVVQPGAIERIAQMCQVSTVTVQTWHTRVWPRGEQLFRLWALLEFEGYSVDELEKIPEPARKIALFVAADLVSYEEVRERLGYRTVDNVYRLLRDRSEPTSQRSWKLQDLAGELQEQYQAFRQQYVPLGQQSLQSTEVTSPVVEVAAVVRDAPCGVSTEVAVKLLKEYIRRADKLDRAELADRVRAEVSGADIESLALFLLELV